MPKTYHQYCPVAHALDLVGERWSLLVVRELLQGPLRYSDLHDRLGCPTNILAARLRRLERDGIVLKRRLPPPAASTVYELTEYGSGLRQVINALGNWGARSLGPPTKESELAEGWLANALACTLAPADPSIRIEFRIDDELASIEGGEVRKIAVGEPDAVVSGDAQGLYHLLVDGDAGAVKIDGDASVLGRALGRPVAKTEPAVAGLAASGD